MYANGIGRMRGVVRDPPTHTPSDEERGWLAEQRLSRRRGITSRSLALAASNPFRPRYIAYIMPDICTFRVNSKLHKFLVHIIARARSNIVRYVAQLPAPLRYWAKLPLGLTVSRLPAGKGLKGIRSRLLLSWNFFSRAHADKNMRIVDRRCGWDIGFYMRFVKAFIDIYM